LRPTLSHTGHTHKTVPPWKRTVFTMLICQQPLATGRLGHFQLVIIVISLQIIQGFDVGHLVSYISSDYITPEK
jgi:hypothetical protein